MRTTQRIRLAALAAGVAGLAVLAGLARSQEPPANPEEMAKYMAEWMKLNAPGAEHKKLEWFVGDWNVATGMAGMPGTGKGSATFALALGGRWLRQDYRGAMDMGGQTVTMEGLGLLGFDRVRNRYVQTWCDNLSTVLLTGTGFFDREGKALQLFGEMDEPQMKVYGKHFKWIVRITGADAFTYEIHDMHIGETGTQVIRLDYTRKKQ